MELERIMCPSCGGVYQEYDPASPVMRCERLGCGAMFRVKQAQEFAKVAVDHEVDIKNLRLLLNNAIETKDMELAAKYSAEIRRLIPDDAFSAYCEALVQKKRGKFEAYHAFLKDALPMTDQEAEKILGIALKEYHFTIHDRAPLETFIAAVYKDKEEEAAKAREQLDAAVKNLARLKDMYAIVPRDVFICHSSSDPIARGVYEALTADGIKCWFSQVNLPPYTMNYWDHIRNAIRNCKIILVIASADSMMRDDPEKEMRYASMLGLHRLELKIDDTQHNTYFRHFFDGLQWVYLGSDVEASFTELKQRIYELLNPAVKEPAGGHVEGGYHVTVRYTTPNGVLIGQEILELAPGEHTIQANQAMVPLGYELISKPDMAVAITPKGAEPKVVTFNYKREEKITARVSVTYRNRLNKDTLFEETVWLENGEHQFKPDAQKVPKGFRLFDEAAVSVSVKDGKANRDEVVFNCEKAKETVPITVKYLGQDGVTVAASQQRNLTPGQHRIFPRLDQIKDGYELVTDSPINITVSASKESNAPVVFYYKLTNAPNQLNGWQKFGKFLLNLVLVVWQFASLLLVAGTGLVEVRRVIFQYTGLRDIYLGLTRWTEEIYRALNLGNVVNGFLDPQMIAYFAPLFGLIILLASLLFGRFVLGHVARRLNKTLVFMILPANSLYFWLVLALRLSDSGNEVSNYAQFIAPTLVLIILTWITRRKREENLAAAPDPALGGSL